MNTRSSKVAGWIVLLLMLCQLLPAGRLRAPSPTPIPARTPEARLLLSKCGNCHSGETRWPKSAFVAPLSWYVVHEVEKARKALNLSVSGQVAGDIGPTGKRRIHALVEADRISTHGTIPGFENSILTASERRQLLDWSVVQEQKP